MEKIRIQFELPKEKVQELEELMKVAHISTKKELLNNALTLFQWAINEKRLGNVLASLDESEQRLKELIMPVLAGIKPIAEEEKRAESFTVRRTQRNWLQRNRIISCLKEVNDSSGLSRIRLREKGMTKIAPYGEKEFRESALDKNHGVNFRRRNCNRGILGDSGNFRAAEVAFSKH